MVYEHANELVDFVRLDVTVSAMLSERIEAAIEEAALAIGRLDARISASFLIEPWQVRSSFLAAENLARVDGTPATAADIIDLVSEVQLNSWDAYLGAKAGYGYWRRALDRLDLSPVAQRVLGRDVTSERALAEKQADLEFINRAPMPARAWRSYEDILELEHRAAEDHAIEAFKQQSGTHSALRALASGIRAATRAGIDPDLIERKRILRVRFAQEWLLRIGSGVVLPLPPFPSDASDQTHPTPPGYAAWDKPEREVWRWCQSFDWIERESRPGPAFGVVATRLRDIGYTANHLTCLTGATRRLGDERRSDERALLGFFRKLALEARAGQALLDVLERTVGAIALSEDINPDPRSPLPLVIYSFLLFPALDPTWVEASLGLQKRVVQKIFKRLSDAGLIVRSGKAQRTDLDGRAARPVSLWTVASLANGLERSSSYVRQSRPTTSIDIERLVARHRDVKIDQPMSAVFQKFDSELIDIGRAYSQYFERGWMDRWIGQTLHRY